MAIFDPQYPNPSVRDSSARIAEQARQAAAAPKDAMAALLAASPVARLERQLQVTYAAFSAPYAIAAEKMASAVGPASIAAEYLRSCERAAAALPQPHNYMAGYLNQMLPAAAAGSGSR